MATIVGQASAAATSVAFPAHQAGDMLLVFARGTAAAPSVPAAGGTVPAWTTLQSGLANAIGLTVASFVATAGTTTTGAWTNATHVCVLVLRPGSGKRLITAAGNSSVGNGNNTQTIIYPALALGFTDGTSIGVRCGTRTVAITAVGTAPASWTAQSIQPAGASALMSTHTRLALAANPTADTVTVTSSNAAYRAVTVEVQEVNLVAVVTVGAVSSAQAFGTATAKAVISIPVVGVPTAQAFGGVKQFVFVGSVYPSGTTPSIVNTFLVGDGHLVGGTVTGRFGTVTAGIAATLKPVGSVSSAAAFGTVTIKTAITRTVVGLSSAQSFGSVTITTTVARAIGAVSSAQAFGSVTASTTAGGVIKSVGSVPSAQAFGSVTVKTAVTRSTGSVPSAQAFGTVTFSGSLVRSVGGVSSAQIFGTPVPLLKTIRAAVGVPSAAAFGVLTFKLTQIAGGVVSAQAFGVVVPRNIVQVRGISSGVNTAILNTFLCGQALIGSSQFGKPTFSFTVPFVGGLGSAQSFGTPYGYGGPVWIPILGLSSAAQFAKPSVFNVWLRPADCIDVSLQPSVCIVQTLEESITTSVDLEPAGCT